MTANSIKIFMQRGFGDDPSEIRERKTVAAFDFVSSFDYIFQSRPIDPGDSCRHHGKIDVIAHGMCITGLAFTAADILFDFLKAGFDFPSGSIILDDLFDGQVEVSGKDGDILCFTKNPNDTDGAFEGFEHNNAC